MILGNNYDVFGIDCKIALEIENGNIRFEPTGSKSGLGVDDKGRKTVFDQMGYMMVDGPYPPGGEGGVTAYIEYSAVSRHLVYK